MKATGQESKSEQAKTALTIALGVYPVFVGLYAAGFFWDIPKDILGAFSFSDLLFKSSVIYSSVSAAFITYTFVSTSLYSLTTDSPSNVTLDDATEPHPYWSRISKRQKRVHFTASLGIYTLFLISIVIDPQEFRLNPSGFALLWAAAFVLTLPARPFIKGHRWKMAAVSYFVVWIILAPLALGFSDAQPDATAPKISIHGASCSLVLIGSITVLFTCPYKYVLVPRDKLVRPLEWTRPAPSNNLEPRERIPI